MNSSRLWIAAIIVAIFIVISFVFSIPHGRNTAQIPIPQSISTSTPLVTFNAAFKKGLYTIVGSVEASDACTIASATATLVGNASSSESILVTVLMPADTGICLQLPTPTNFSTSITAPAHLPITVTINGIMASTTSP